MEDSSYNVSLEKKNSILRLISGKEDLLIESLGGGTTIAKSGEVFKSYIDPIFDRPDINRPDHATDETFVDVYEMVGDGTFTQVLTLLSDDPDRIVMTQSQIVRFCEKYPDWLRQEGFSTFFLIKIDSGYPIVRVTVYSDYLNIFGRRRDHGFIWRAACRSRLVCPRMRT